MYRKNYIISKYFFEIFRLIFNILSVFHFFCCYFVLLPFSEVEQLAACWAHNPKVKGSTPFFTTILIFMYITQLCINFFVFLISILGILFNKKSIIISLMCIELMLLSLNLNFVIFSVYLDDMYGMIFSIFILTLSAAESAIGLAIVIAYYRVKGNIFFDQNALLKN